MLDRDYKALPNLHRCSYTITSSMILMIFNSRMGSSSTPAVGLYFMGLSSNSGGVEHKCASSSPGGSAALHGPKTFRLGSSVKLIFLQK